MIPKKLYIPTSTLNFNNIMSSESISPSAFYANRRFGYKRFEKVAPNNLDNQIILYSKYPIFDINDKERENYPLVIEIDTQDISDECIQEKNGYFFTLNTIYFNPFSTRIIFRTNSERATSISKAEPSIESKLIPLYQDNFIILSDEIETFKWNLTTLEDSLDYNHRAISYDIVINKLKGLFYGYLLGANESLPKEIVALKRMTKDLRNVLSAILASPDGYATNFQQQQLDSLYASINQSFYMLGGVESRIKEVIAHKIEFYKSPRFIEILKGEGLYQEWFMKQISQLNLRYYQIAPFTLSYKSMDKVSELDRYIDNIERMIQTYYVKTKLEISKLPVIQSHRIIDVPEQKESLSMLFNEYLDEAWNGTEFMSSRYEFAKVGGKLFREIAGDKWENSPARTYINSLLKNLNEYTEFDINSTESDILKSFAAFCQRGENDIDKLKDYLISNGISDFRIAFALWGLVFGFAEMPKTLTNELFEDKDNQYISMCYKYIHKQLYSIELQGTLDRMTEEEENVTRIWQGLKSIGKKVVESFTGKTMEQNKESSSSHFQSRSDNRVTTIPEELKLLYNCEVFKEIPLLAQQYYKKESLALYHGQVDKAFVDSLKKLEYPKTKGKWQNALKTIIQKQKKEKRIDNLQTLSLFPQESTGNFLRDIDFLRNNVEFRNLVSGIKGWEKDLKWFIEAHNPYHEDYKYYEGKSTDNESVIKQFIFLKKEKYKNTESFLRKTYLK